MSLRVKKRWRGGDTVTINGVRWVIRIVRTNGEVELEAANTVNHGIWWHTTIDKLPVPA